MLSQLDRRFDFLVSRRVDIAPRHRTLRAALEYSFIQLPMHLQQLFVRLSVFRGGWSLSAACAISDTDSAPQVLTALADLREYSLIVAEERLVSPPGKTEMRYQMLDSLREFAAEQHTIATGGEPKQAQAEYFLRMAEEANSHLAAYGQDGWMNRLDIENDNLRAALQWFVETRATDFATRLAIALAKFWDIRGYQLEARQWLGRMIELPVGSAEADLKSRAELLGIYSETLESLSEYPGAKNYAKEALDLWRALDYQPGINNSLKTLGLIAMLQEDYASARTLLEETLASARNTSDVIMIAKTAQAPGRIAIAQENWQDAWQMISESLDLHRAQGDQNRVAGALNNLGLIARYRGDLPAARELLNQSLAMKKKIGDRPGAAISRVNIGTIDRLEGRHSEALLEIELAMSLAMEVGDRRVQAWCIKELGHLTLTVGRIEMGLRFLSAAELSRASLRMSFKPAGPSEIARDRAAAESALGSATAEAVWASGRTAAAEQLFAGSLQELKHDFFKTI